MSCKGNLYTHQSDPKESMHNIRNYNPKAPYTYDASSLASPQRKPMSLLHLSVPRNVYQIRTYFLLKSDRNNVYHIECGLNKLSD